MAGKQKSVYVTDEVDEMVLRHMKRTGRSYSWCYRDLALRGNKVASIQESVRAGYE